MADEIKDKLNERQELFCLEYLVDLNATQAAIRAGYSENTAASIASQNLTKLNIRSRIKELSDERSSRTLVDAYFVITNLRDIALKCQSKVPVMVFDPINKAMVQKQDDEGNNVWEFDSTGANKSLELLGRHLAMFTDKTKQSIEVKTDLKPFFNPLNNNVNSNNGNK